MDFSKTLYDDPEKAQAALNTLSPVMWLVIVIGVIAAAIILWALVKFLRASAKLNKVLAPEPERGARAGHGKEVATKAGKAQVSGRDYAGLTREEMRLVFEAEVKRRREAGEEVTIKNPFEGPLDWDDMDAKGRIKEPKKKRPRPQATAASASPPPDIASPQGNAPPQVARDVVREGIPDYEEWKRLQDSAKALDRSKRDKASDADSNDTQHY